MNTEVITLGGGCFWCVEAVYELVDGVTAVSCRPRTVVAW